MTPDAAARLLRVARERHRGPGPLVICVDGPAGSGKTTLAGQLAEAVPGGTVVHTDDATPGWTALDRLDLTPVLAPLTHGRAGRYRRYDWVAGALADEVPVWSDTLVVVDGVGSGNRAWSPYVDALGWVETDRTTGLARALARDGVAQRAHLLRWQRDERALFAREGTRERADVLLRT